MACPNGCINGGGQPIPAYEEIIRARSKAIYDLDNGSKIHAAHMNPSVKDFYKDCLGEPGGKKSKALLHTSYNLREVFL
jgi:iron only hydrogenase large subunit-like protein